MKLIFAGTPDIAATALQALLRSDHEIAAVYTQPDRPAGRGRKLTPSPVKQIALTHHIPVEQPLNFKDDSTVNTLKQYQADAMIVLAYGLLLPESVLKTPTHGCLNLHVSLLPRWRGAAPIQHALLQGDAETGVTVMQMDAGLDTGDIHRQVTCPIMASDTSETLHQRLAHMAVAPLLDTLEALADGTATTTAQDDTLATYAPKISKADAQVDWQQPAVTIDRCIRAYHPWPIAHTPLGNDTLRLWQAHPTPSDNTQPAGTILAANNDGITVQTGHDAITLTQLQLPGKKALPAGDLLRAHAHRFNVGSLL